VFLKKSTADQVLRLRWRGKVSAQLSGKEPQKTPGMKKKAEQGIFMMLFLFHLFGV